MDDTKNPRGGAIVVLFQELQVKRAFDRSRFHTIIHPCHYRRLAELPAASQPDEHHAPDILYGHHWAWHDAHHHIGGHRPFRRLHGGLHRRHNDFLPEPVSWRLVPWRVPWRCFSPYSSALCAACSTASGNQRPYSAVHSHPGHHVHLPFASSNTCPAPATSCRVAAIMPK
jgi:hypothetical protein